jgi:mono/diheme cytochrome c family protein
MRLALAAAALLVLAASAAEASQVQRIAAGRMIAKRNCGGCHAVGQGASPLPGAPPFRELYRRYPPGGLEQLLKEGMLAPEAAPEEGSARRHPRMPQVSLGPDEVANLKAFLQSLEPGRTRPRRRR